MAGSKSKNKNKGTKGRPSKSKPAKPKQQKCSACDLTFTKPHQLARHERQHHIGSICCWEDTCLQTFESDLAMQKHWMEHNAKAVASNPIPNVSAEKQHDCCHCAKCEYAPHQMVSREALKRHLRECQKDAFEAYQYNKQARKPPRSAGALPGHIMTGYVPAPEPESDPEGDNPDNQSASD